jgi:hypothetical protein
MYFTVLPVLVFHVDSPFVTTYNYNIECWLIIYIPYIKTFEMLESSRCRYCYVTIFVFLKELLY